VTIHIARLRCESREVATAVLRDVRLLWPRAYARRAGRVVLVVGSCVPRLASVLAATGWSGGPVGNWKDGI
jgi:hypothetical protein